MTGDAFDVTQMYLDTSLEFTVLCDTVSLMNSFSTSSCSCITFSSLDHDATGLVQLMMPVMIITSYRHSHRQWKQLMAHF